MIRPDLIFPLIKVSLLAILAFLCLVAAEKRWKLLSKFRSEPSSAVNLAIARCVIMAALLSKVSLNYELAYSRINGSLIIPPLGWSHIASRIPRSPELVTLIYAVFVFFGILAVIGLYGQLACLVTSAAGFYLLTLPQLFGKINHDHHLILFGFILAASPCADTLSIDAIRDAVRSARRGLPLEKLKVSVAYANPLKIMMVLLGLIYFFPGSWKVARVGAAWFSADNMRWTMAAKLLEAPGTITSFQAWAMHHSLFLLIGAISTPMFELGFIFAVFSRYTRPLAALGGIAFHNLVGLLMNIRFVSLQLCYVVLIDWAALFSWIAARLGIHRIVLRYGSDPIELQVVNFVAKFDWLDLVSIEAAELAPIGEFDSSRYVQPLTVADERGEQSSGFDACVYLSKRIVLLWPVYLLLRVPFIRVLAEGLYDHLTRDQDARIARIIVANQIALSPARGTALLKPLSMLLIAGMILAGLSHSVDAWPIACYPTFDHPGSEQITELSVAAVDDDGHFYRQTLSFDQRISATLSPERYDAMVGILLRQDVAYPRESAAALVELWRQSYEYPRFREVTFYSDTYLFNSDGRPGRLIQDREIFHLSRQDGLE
jgi:hypothetical protein